MKSRPLILAGTLLLSACTGKPTTLLLPAEERGRIKALDVVLVLPQTEIAAEVPEISSTALGFILFGIPGVFAQAIFDKGANADRARRADVAIAPVRAALAGHDFDGVFQREIERVTAQWPELGPRPPTVIKDASTEKLEAALAASAGRTLFISGRYALTRECDKLIVASSTSLFRPKKRRRGDPNPKPPLDLENASYFNSQLAEYALAGAGTDVDANRAAWLSNDAALLRRALAEGIAAVADLVALDLSATGDPPGQHPRYRERIKGKNGYARGYVLDQKGGGRIVRMDTGELKLVASLVPAPSPAAAPVVEPSAVPAAPAEPAAAAETP